MKFLTLLVITGVSLMLSVKNRQEDKCHLFNGSERPRDTLTLNVTYIGLVLLPPNNNTLSYMEKKKLLESKNFKSSLLFKVANCPFEYNLLYSSELKGNSTAIPENTRVQITCVLFRDSNIPLFPKEPFPIITKVKVID